LYGQSFKAQASEGYAALLVQQGRNHEALILLQDALRSRILELERLNTPKSGLAKRAGLAFKLRSSHLDTSAAIASSTKDESLARHAVNASLLIKNLEVQRNPIDKAREGLALSTFDMRDAGLSLTNKLRETLADEYGGKAVYVDIVKSPPLSRLTTRRGDYRYTAFVIAANKNIVALDLGSSDKTDQMIATLLQAQGEDQDGAGETARNLSMTILDPILSVIDSETQILINPDGDFSRLPVGYINNVIRSANSNKQGLTLELVLGLRSTRDSANATPSRPIVIGNPGYGKASVDVNTTRAASIKDSSRSRRQINTLLLPHTQREGELVTKLVDGQFIQGRVATANAFLSITNPRILHVAAHGFFAPDEMDMPALPGLTGDVTFRRPADASSGLVLAPESRGNSTYSLVTAGEIAKMKLHETELVVLSACDTGLGILGQGSAMTALAAAIFNAGAKNVIVTLWPVADRATAAFMVHFYTAYTGGASVSDALSKTRELFADGIIQDPLRQEDWQRPYYWGAFQLIRRLY
jgi:CHAT domain-containing protein